VSSFVDVVELALDRYVSEMGKRGVDPNGIRVQTLAQLAGVPRKQMSVMLQEYRYRQGALAEKDPPQHSRYVVGCEGYGRAARWSIMAKPKTDPVVVQNNRMDHAIYVAQDAVNRLVRDYTAEVYPGMRKKEIDEVVEIATRGLVEHVKVDVNTAVQFIRRGGGHNGMGALASR
jgi:plasmid maintenance system antidote protein VapI